MTSDKASMGRGRAIATIAWAVLLAIFALYCALGARGEVGLASRLGPEPAVRSGPAAFKFAVIGDTHSFRRPWSETLARSRADECRFIIHLGDFVDYDDDIEYRRFVRRTLAAIGRDGAAPQAAPPTPVFLVRGNHETMSVDGGFTDRFVDHVPQSDYSFEYGGCLFHVLDDSSGVLQPEQLARLQSALVQFRAKSPTGLIFLFLHMPPTLSDSDYSALSPASSEALLEIARATSTHAIFAGDVHRHIDRTVEGIRLIVTGCGGGSLQAPSEEVHFVKVSVAGTQVSMERVPVNREPGWVNKTTYFFSITVPRYRWYFFAGAVLLLGYEVQFAMRRRKPRQTDLLQPMI